MDSDAKHHLRREFILRMIEVKGLIYYSEIKDHYPGTTRQQIKGDLEIMAGNGLVFETEQDGRDRCIYCPHSSRDSTYQRRLRIQAKEKEEVAIGVERLVLISRSGKLPEWLNQQLSSEYERLLRLNGTKSRAMLDQKFESIRRRLMTFAAKRTRTLFLDAGTTNFAVARQFSKLSLPSAQNAVDEVDVWTNSRHISCLLGSYACSVRTGWVGGTQRMQNEAICDGIAVRFVDTLMPAIDMAIIGAVGITEEFFKSDNKDDASLKAHVAGRSELVLVSATHSKFSNQLGNRAFTSQVMETSAVDLIVVDKYPECDFEINLPVLNSSKVSAE